MLVRGSKRSQGWNEARSNLSKRLKQISFCHDVQRGGYKDLLENVALEDELLPQEWSRVTRRCIEDPSEGFIVTVKLAVLKWSLLATRWLSTIVTTI